MANELERKPYEVKEDFIIAKTRPSFFSGSWEEQIIILFVNNRILVNSICDSEKRSAIVSIRRNKKNMYRFIEEISKSNTYMVSQ